MGDLRKKTLDYLLYVSLRAVGAYIHVSGLRISYRTARFLGDLMYRFDRRHRQRALRHLELSFPVWSAAKRRQVARASMRNLLYLGLEIALTTRMITPARWRRHVRLANMAATIRRLLLRQTGLIFLTGHFGNWEVTGYTMATLGFPTYAMARALNNPYVNRWLLGVRENTGLVILDKFGATMQTEDLLRDRQVVGFIADQTAGRKGCFVDFFGRKASTYRSIALLAMRHRAPIVVAYGRRLGESFQFEIGVSRTILPAEWADKDDPATWITQEYTRALEDVVRSAPEQYVWTHRRWKHRPAGEREDPDGVA